MEGDDKRITVLNELLGDELTSMGQYMVRSEICDNGAHDRPHQAIEHQAHDEMHHAEWLIRRILFLQARPIVSKLNPIKIDPTVMEGLSNNQPHELGPYPSITVPLAWHTKWPTRPGPIY